MSPDDTPPRGNFAMRHELDSMNATLNARLDEISANQRETNSVLQQHLVLSSAQWADANRRAQDMDARRWDERITALENFVNEIRGMASLIKVVFGASLLTAIYTAYNIVTSVFGK